VREGGGKKGTMGDESYRKGSTGVLFSGSKYEGGVKRGLLKSETNSPLILKIRKAFPVRFCRVCSESFFLRRKYQIVKESRLSKATNVRQISFTSFNLVKTDFTKLNVTQDQGRLR